MLSTELTRTFDLRHPVVSAPMANWAGGALAGAVSAGGGLGMIGVAGYFTIVRKRIQWSESFWNVRSVSG